jgi:hypothetical protein
MKKIANRIFDMLLGITEILLIITGFSMIPVTILNWHNLIGVPVKIFAVAISIIGLVGAINLIYDAIKLHKKAKKGGNKQ